MTANRTQHAADDPRLILELKIDTTGEVTHKATKLGRKDTLEGKLLAQLYPGIRVARISVSFRGLISNKELIKSQPGNRF